jgi:hypothetical protein
MKRFVYASLVGGSLLLASSFSVLAHEGAPHKESDEKSTTVVGELIDSACFTSSDGDAKGKDHAECARKCMATGIPAGILPEGKGEDDALVMLTNPKVFAPYAAQIIKVEGIVNAEKHLIDVKKAYVKDGENWKEITLDDEHHKMGGGDEKKDDMKGMDMKGMEHDKK